MGYIFGYIIKKNGKFFAHHPARDYLSDDREEAAIFKSEKEAGETIDFYDWLGGANTVVLTTDEQEW